MRNLIFSYPFTSKIKLYVNFFQHYQQNPILFFIIRNTKIEIQLYVLLRPCCFQTLEGTVPISPVEAFREEGGRVESRAIRYRHYTAFKSYTPTIVPDAPSAPRNVSYAYPHHYSPHGSSGAVPYRPVYTHCPCDSDVSLVIALLVC